MALAVALALAGCADDSVAVPDATRFDPRDAVVDPRPDVTLDSGAAADGGQVDVIPFDATSDAGGSDGAGPDGALTPDSCASVAERYAATVREAEACTAGSACTTLVCETLCCACQVYVNPGTPAAHRLADLRSRWAAMACAHSVDCPGISCDRPVSAACSSEGRCVTLRAPGDGGL